MNEYMDGWMDGWMEEWMDGCLSILTPKFLLPNIRKWQNQSRLITHKLPLQFITLLCKCKSLKWCKPSLKIVVVVVVVLI
jgi:hypothetical protein